MNTTKIAISEMHINLSLAGCKASLVENEKKYLVKKAELEKEIEIMQTLKDNIVREES